MKRIKLVALALVLLFSTALMNDAKASEKVNVIKIEQKKVTKTKTLKKPSIIIIYITGMCPNGSIGYFGNICLSDSGGFVGWMYWGEDAGCAASNGPEMFI